ncbi:MAG TPA: YcxB family protein [Chitinophagaceae bacterium]|nr:YcxB family protein [Chitinophagaceae bacterium]MCB9054582.1 YcxB family protein [Chitinophagales bacterium]HPG10224.1 YcxB family protein [Chitinophagaceae bacterium]
MTISFGYDKKQVIQALRYHFISRPEIRIMLILVNVFAIATFTLYFMNKITPMAFLVGSFLWLVLMISFWFILPFAVYKRAVTFRHNFSMRFDENDFTLSHTNGSRSWPWTALKSFLETPHFFHLYFDARSFLLVPKSGCKDSDEVHELRTLIKSKVKKG